MLAGIIKYSDERNRRYSIKTTVVSNSTEAYVVKECVFPDGKGHIKAMYENQEKLKIYYPNVKVCNGVMDGDDKIKFDFICGDSLENRYIAAVNNQDKAEFERLLQLHKAIILGSEDNQCEFCVNDDFERIFGSGQVYVGIDGLKYSNFDAIPSNIIFQEDNPTFIDYEWVMDFVMPLDLVIYNCIDNLYLKNKMVEDFYAKEDALKYLRVQSDINDLKNSYASFFNYIITDSDGRSYANDKISCLKPLDTIKGIRDEWEKCSCEWKNAVDIVEKMEKELVELRENYANQSIELTQAREEWQKCADEWKNAVAIVEEREKELDNAREEWQKCADEWKNAVAIVEEKDKEILEIRQEWQKCADAWKNAVAAGEEKDKELAALRLEKDEYIRKYEDIINSKSWKMINKLRKPLDVVKKKSNS